MATGNALFDFPAAMMIGDTDAQLVANDLYPTFTLHEGRMSLAFDAGSDEEVALTPTMEMPSHYSGGGLTARVLFYMASATTGNAGLGIYVEKVTPDTETGVLNSTTSFWAAVNSGTKAVAATAGRPYVMTVTLTNDDGAVAGDMVRFAVRRETNGGDTAAGDLYLTNLVIEET